MKKLDKEDILERIAHLITSGIIDDKTFEFYFSGTSVGYMNYEQLLNVLKGENNEKIRNR